MELERDQVKCEQWSVLFDGKFAFLAIFAYSLIDSAIGTAADETNDVISISDPDLTGVPTWSPRVNGLCRRS
jgi:hypothetical protein